MRGPAASPALPTIEEALAILDPLVARWPDFYWASTPAGGGCDLPQLAVLLYRGRETWRGLRRWDEGTAEELATVLRAVGPAGRSRVLGALTALWDRLRYFEEREGELVPELADALTGWPAAETTTPREVLALVERGAARLEQAIRDAGGEVPGAGRGRAA